MGWGQDRNRRQMRTRKLEGTGDTGTGTGRVDGMGTGRTPQRQYMGTGEGTKELEGTEPDRGDRTG